MSSSLSRRGLRLSPFLVLLCLNSLAVLGAPSRGSAQGLTLTASPSARWIDWDEDLGFKQSRLWGGSVGIGFGRYVALQAFHNQEDALRLFESVEEGTTPQLFDLRQSGVKVSLGLGSGTIVPMVTGGGSLLSFRPVGGEKLKKLSLDYGGGLRAVLGENLQADVMVESSQLRLDPVFLSTGEPGFEGVGPLRRNLTLSASLGLQLGRRSFDPASGLDDAFAQRYQAPFSNFALAVEPLIGRLDYDKAVGLDNQEMVGVRAGFDFGSFFGLRGFHWWGTESDFRSTTEFRSYGGEAQFTLVGGPGLNPYLTAGAGELSWGKAKEGDPPHPEDQTALILGGGVDFNFGRRIRATVTARDFILAGSDLSASPDLNTISDPDELIHNWQFSAGLKFLVGPGGIRSGRAASPATAPVPKPEAPGTSPAAQEPAVAGQTQEQPALAQPTAVVVEPQQVQPPVAPPMADTSPPGQVPALEMPNVERVVEVDTLIIREAPANTIVLPILEKGEIYIRFGEPGSTPLVTAVRQQGEPLPVQTPTGEERGPTLEEIRLLIQQELARQPERQPVDTEALRELESRLLRRLDQVEEAGGRAQAAAAAPPPAPVVVTPTAPDTLIVVPQEPGLSPEVGRRVEEIRPYSGFNLTGDFQLLLGFGGDIGPLKPGSRFRLVPQVALGFGQGPASLLISADVEYRLPEVDAGKRAVFEPLVSAGPGLIERDNMALQLGIFLGTGIQLKRRNGTPGLNLFTGIQGVGFFDDTRFIIGFRRLR